LSLRHRPLAASLLGALLAAVPILGATASSPVASAEPLASLTATAPASLGDRAWASAEVPDPSDATACARRVRDELNIEERVGQLFLLGIGSRLGDSEAKLIQKRHLGSVTFSAFVPTGIAGVRAVADAVQALATPTATHHVGFLVAANQEGGMVQALSGTGFSKMPSALSQGRLDPERLRADAGTWGQQLSEAGVNLDLAPVADTVPRSWVSRNAPIGHLKREFGHTPEVVAPHVAAFIEGMQAADVLTTAKHFPGLGRVRGNTDFASRVRDTVTTSDSPFLEPFQVAVDAAVPFVMTSLASYRHLDGNRLAAFSRRITTGMLRHTMGFDGVIVSDDLSAVAVEAVPPEQRATRFLRAGGNLLTVTNLHDVRRMADALVQEAGANAAFRALVDDSALRVLQAKASAGLLTCSD
jgi:beta-N-acetylhexosaminidase